jgi:hypothetical protein
MGIGRPSNQKQWGERSRTADGKAAVRDGRTGVGLLGDTGLSSPLSQAKTTGFKSPLVEVALVAFWFAENGPREREGRLVGVMIRSQLRGAVKMLECRLYLSDETTL